MYADDLMIFHSIEHPGDRLLVQEDLDRFALYCDKNQLFLNFSQCSTITFKRRSGVLLLSFTISNSVIKCVESVRDLGVILDIKLLFYQHIYRMRIVCLVLQNCI